MRSLPKVLGLLAVLLLTGLLTSQGLGAPFDDSDQGWGGAFYSLAARNLLRYPPDTTLLAMCVEPGALAPAPEVYFNHPPMVAWLVALSFSVFGEAEWAARLPLWLLSLGAAGALYGLLLRLGPRDGARERALWAAAGALAAVGCPAWVYYGSMVDPQGSGVLFAVALACLGAARWLEGGRRADAALCLGALGFGFLFDWPVYLAAAGLALGALRTGRRRAAAAVAGLTAAAAAGTAVWIAAAYGRMAAQFTIAEGFLNRTGLKETLADDTGAAVSAGQLIAGLLDHHGAAGGPSPWPAPRPGGRWGSAGGGAGCRRRRGWRCSPRRSGRCMCCSFPRAPMCTSTGSSTWPPGWARRYRWPSSGGRRRGGGGRRWLASPCWSPPAPPAAGCGLRCAGAGAQSSGRSPGRSAAPSPRLSARRSPWPARCPGPGRR